MLKLGRVFNTLKLKIENKASTAVFGGVAGLISAGTMAAKATPQFEKDWAEAKENQRKYKHYVAVAKANHGAKIGTFAIPRPEDGQDISSDEASVKEFVNSFCDENGVVQCSKSDSILFNIRSYAFYAQAFLKNYGAALTVGSLSVASIIWGHSVIVKRLQQTTAAYNTVKRVYDSYRDEVKEQLGEENESEIHQKAVVRAATVDVLEESKDDAVIAVNLKSIGAVAIDVDGPDFNGDDHAARKFILTVQNTANDLLQARGHLFLNELYDLLGEKRIPQGNILGWVRKTRSGEPGVVDLRVFTIESPDGNVETRQGFLWVRPEVQGIIVDLI
jgi:gp069